ncbi:MAG TPA: hypothetical protein VFF33_06755 [Ignavibacteriaceae bacterium]|nr:hypothetical protein [Ignavibacteriaceae bacterium]
MVKLKFLISLIFLLSFNALAQSITAEASTDTSAYLIGDQIKYTLKITYDKNIKILEPIIKDSLKNVEVISFDKPVVSENDNKKISSYSVILSKFDSSDVIITPIEIKYTAGDSSKSILSNAVSFKVIPVKVSQEEDIKDIKNPEEIPPDWKMFVLYFLIALAACSLIYFLIKKYLKKRAEKPKVIKEIIIPPHVTALAALTNLEKESLWEKGEIKEYHSRITSIIRNYFEGRFNLPALELTTSETMELLNKQDVPKEVNDITYSFLSNADMVKFAKFVPLEDINKQMMKDAYQIVESTMEEETVQVNNV